MKFLCARQLRKSPQFSKSYYKNKWMKSNRVYTEFFFAVIVIIMISGSIKIRKPTPACITQGKMHNSKPSWARSNRLQTYSMMNNKEEWTALLTWSLTGISVGAGPVVRQPQWPRAAISIKPPTAAGFVLTPLQQWDVARLGDLSDAAG